MPDINRDPVRKIALPFAGDPWAQPGAQVQIPEGVQRLSVTASSLRLRVVGYDGVGPLAAPVDAADATYDYTTVKLRSDRRGAVTLAQTVPLSVSAGGEAPVGDRQVTEDDVSDAEIVCLGIPSVTQGTTPAIWIFVDAGARLVGPNGTL